VNELTYAEFLNRAIKKSGLSLDQISMKISFSGASASKQYLSRLQNGKTPPAGDKLHDALAEILKVDPVELKAAAYREKIPPEVLVRLNPKEVV
jgi:repressor LexA